MDGGVIGTWVGTVVSVFGAGVAIQQAGQARTAAGEVRRVRDDLVDHRKAAELAHLENACQHAVRSMAKYGPSSTVQSIAGVDYHADAREVQDLLVSIKEYQAHFDGTQPNGADKLWDDVTPLLDKWSAATNPSDVRNLGYKVFVQLTSFSSTIKRQADIRRDTVR